MKNLGTNYNEMRNRGLGVFETKEARALHINVIRPREMNRIRKKNLEMFSL